MDEQAMWTAVLERDATVEGRLYYGVRSTGVVCRTTCPSRRPRRDQAVFFESLHAALAGGFRPCRRCRPERDAHELQHHAEVRRACDLLYHDPALSIADIALRLELTPRQLQRAFRWWLGLSPREYRAACRLSRFKALATDANDATAAALDAGYPSLAGLYEHAGALGMTPAAYRWHAPGTEVRFTTGDSELGLLLVAATGAGICALRFGDARDSLVEELRREFAGAEIVEDRAALAPWLRLVGEYLSGRARMVPLPLDVHGTLFQLRVWAALIAIPPGESRTYGEIARAIGRPGAARAVGRACAANPVALGIPCHRLVGSDGEGGYRWGVERKRRLLECEGARNSSGSPLMDGQEAHASLGRPPDGDVQYDPHVYLQ